MNRGVDRQPVFFDDVDRVEFGRRLADIHAAFGATTLAYCLMSNHYHLLLRLPNGGLSEAMHHLGSVYTRHTNDRVGRDGPLFRGRFHSIPVATDPYLLWVIRYIHRNALDLPGVSGPDRYRWSSYRALLGYRTAPEFLDTDFVLGLFDGDRTRLAEFTDDSSLRPTLDGSIADAGATIGSVIECAIAQDELRHDEEFSSQGLARTIKVLVASRTDDPVVRAAVENDLPVGASNARRMAESRARRRLVDEPKVRRVLEFVLATLAPIEPRTKCA